MRPVGSTVFALRTDLSRSRGMRVRRGSASRAGIVHSPTRTATIAAAMKAYHASNAMNGQRNIATAAMMPDATSTSIELSIPPLMHVTCPREGAPGLNDGRRFW